MKILVTGGTGFIGSHFLQLLGEGPHSVCCVRRAASRTCVPLDRNPIWIEKELDALEVEDFSGVDVVVHLASPGVSPKPATWEQLFHWNVQVLLQMLERATSAGVRRWVIAGTFAEYGRSSEDYDFIPPTAPLRPTTAYAASKAASSVLADAFAADRSLELCYLRIFSAFGSGQSATNFWPALRAAALEGRDFAMTAGEQIRDYIAVEKVAEAFLHAIEREDVRAGRALTYNVASGIPVSMRQFAEHWWKKWEAKGSLHVGKMPYRPNEPMRYVPLLS